MQKLRQLAILAMLVAGITVYASAGEIDPGLENILGSTGDRQPVSVLVYLNDQVNLNAITDQMDNVSATLRHRHEVVVRSLQQTAEASQGSIVNHLSNLKNEGRIDDFQAFWITNAVRVNAFKNEIEQLANHPDVARIYFNYEIELIEPVEIKKDTRDDITSIEIGVEAVRAPEVWAMGIDGTGVLVANMDTGVDGNHSALSDRWVGVADPRYQGHPEWAWYDPYAGQTFPSDQHGHGTHTMGSVCGASSSTGDTVGVAPGAYWMASAPIDRGGGIPQTVADAILSFQWMADPDGNPATNWDVPAVCSNSWGLVTSHGYPPCDTLFWSYLDACEAAGTVILFSAGNEGFSGLRRPADRATDDYRTCAVAAVDANYPNWPIAGFSSRGPTYCTPDGSPAIKPDIAAPGVDVRSCYPGGGYTEMSGTSMASPHVNGVVALMRQANPNLSVEMLKQIIYDTAYDLGSAGEDNDYGWGMVDAYEAVQMAISFLEGYGVIMGQVTDLVSGDGLPGTVTIINRVPQIVAQCNSGGYYTMYVPADSTWILKAEYTWDYQPEFASVMVAEDDTVIQNFALQPPDFAIELIPDDPPIYLHPGESFTFTGILSNQTDQPQLCDMAIYLDAPNIGMYGPLAAYFDIPMQPYQTITVPGIVQYIPNFAPIGLYRYIAFAGRYPQLIAQDEFNFVVFPPGGSLAQVCILCADYENDWHEARDLLLADPNVLGVDFIDVQTSTPSLQDLLAYNVLLVWSNYTFADANALGDVIADFVDIGGAVVTAEFAHFGGWAVGGRYMNEYSPLGVGSNGYTNANLVVDDPNHPIMLGITSGTEYYDYDAPLQGNSPMMLCHWDNGYNGTVVNGEYLRCVAINDYFGQTSRQWTGDIGQMMVQAVTYAANNSFSVGMTSPEGFFDSYAGTPMKASVNMTNQNSRTATEVIRDYGKGAGAVFPVEFALMDAYPNPFNATAQIGFALPDDSDVCIEIYNLAGQKVSTLVDGCWKAGFHKVTWDGSANSSGIYFYKLTAGDKVFTKRMTLLK